MIRGFIHATRKCVFCLHQNIYYVLNKSPTLFGKMENLKLNRQGIRLFIKKSSVLVRSANRTAYRTIRPNDANFIEIYHTQKEKYFIPWLLVYL